MSREDVELFCIDKQILVEVTATEEALIFDFESTTSVPHEHSVRITFLSCGEVVAAVEKCACKLI